MTQGKITTSENTLGGEKIEITPEMKAIQKASDEIALKSYSVLIDQRNLEIAKLENAIKLDLPNREVLGLIEEHKKEIKRAEDFKKIVEDRMNGKF